MVMCGRRRCVDGLGVCLGALCGPGVVIWVVLAGCEIIIKTWCEQYKKLSGGACGGHRPPTHHLMGVTLRILR